VVNLRSRDRTHERNGLRRTASVSASLRTAAGNPNLSESSPSALLVLGDLPALCGSVVNSQKPSRDAEGWDVPRSTRDHQQKRKGRAVARAASF